MKDSPQGVYCKLKDLIGLQHKARGFSFKPQQPLTSLLAGRHASQLRGRGLDFEELRLYHPGDDIRTIDWKVSNRARKPYVRVYGEEKERSVRFIVDQRLSMFFGSVKNMKSVTAAELLALGAWRVIDSGDRVGGTIFNDTQCIEIPPQRSRRAVMHLLSKVVEQNNELSIHTGIKEDKAQLNKALYRTAAAKLTDSLIVIISDFSGLDQETEKYITKISSHNDIILMPVYDPLAKKFPEQSISLRLGDGSHQMLINLNEKKVIKKLPELLEGRLKSLTDALSKFGVPILPINCAEETDKQLRSNLGAGALSPTAGKGHNLKGVR